MASECRRYTAGEAREVALRLGVDLRRLGVTGRELARGMNVEREHADAVGCSRPLLARIALSHLRERIDYYVLLAKYVEGAPKPRRKRRTSRRQ
jgi:hypothetical protein